MPGLTPLTRMPSLATSRAIPITIEVNRALSGGIPDTFIGAAKFRRHRRQHDHRAAFAAVLGRHAANAGAQAPQRAERVDVEDLADSFAVGFIQAATSVQ